MRAITKITAAKLLVLFNLPAILFLAGAIEKILRNPDQAERLSARGLKRAENFSMQRLAETYSKSYEAILAN